MHRRIVKSEAISEAVSSVTKNSTPNVIDLRNKSKIKFLASPEMLKLCEEWATLLKSPDVDEVKLFNNLITSLVNKSHESRLEFSEAFSLLYKHQFGTAAQVLRRHLKNSELEISLELISGFNQHRTAN